MSKIFAIGDIHGCHQTLNELLDLINPRAGQDRIVFLGDYINRGPCSKEVIEQIISVKKTYPGTITLMGNHEQILLASLAGGETDFFLRMGGKQTLASYGLKENESSSLLARIPASHLAFLENLMFLWHTEDYIFVHAGLQPGLHLSQQSAQWCCWARDDFINSNFDFGRKIIFGHTPFSNPLMTDNKIGIDTGTVYGGKLTCLVLPERELIKVDCRDKPIWPGSLKEVPPTR